MGRREGEETYPLFAAKYFLSLQCLPDFLWGLASLGNHWDPEVGGGGGREIILWGF